MRRHVFAVAMGAALLLEAAACSDMALDDVEPEGGISDVVLKDGAFSPRVIEVEAGTEVTWIWDDHRPHDVQGDGFESRVQSDGTFSYRFETPGTYDYICSLHRNMDGRVVVAE